MIKDERYDNWKELVSSVSKSVARDFPGVEAADLYQELWLWIYTYGNQHPDGSSKKALRTVANKAAWSYRRQQLTLNDQYAYRVADVRRVVEYYLFDDRYVDTGILMDDEVMGVVTGVYGDAGVVRSDQEKPFVVDAIRGNVPVDYVDRIVAKTDVEVAFRRLNERDQEILIRIYRDGLESTAAETKRAYRAIEKMTDYLNYNRGNNGSQ